MVKNRTALCLALVMLLASVYMVTYSGQMEVADQIRYFDITANMVRVGEPVMSYSIWDKPPYSVAPSAPHPLRYSEVEPGLMTAGAPLYWLAENVPGLGLVHTTWLVNIIATALIGGVMFWYVLALGYSERTALIGALCLGLLTVLWTYSQTYFREPLVTLFLLAGAMLLEYARRQFGMSRGRGVLLIVGAVAMLALAYVTKEAVVMALPALVVLALPETLWRQRWWRVLTLVGLVGLLVVSVVMAYTPLLDTLEPAHPYTYGNITFAPNYGRTALHSYMFSVGGSFWGGSPILLLALPGMWLLWRRDPQHGGARVVTAALVMVFSFCLGYALFRGEQWYGGDNYPQRFLVPLLPFGILLVLPIIKRLPRNRVLLMVTVLIGGYSLWWQLGGVAFRWQAYSFATRDISGGLAYWSGGFNELRYLRPVMLTSIIGQYPANFAWARGDLPLWGVANVVLVIVALVTVIQTLRGRWLRISVVLPVAWLVVTGLGLRALHNTDTAYIAPEVTATESLHAMIGAIRERTLPGDVLLLSDPTYLDYFLNYGKVGQVYVVSLPYHPGERGSAEQPLQIVSDNPDVLLRSYTPLIVHKFAEVQRANGHDRFFLLTSGGPEIVYSMRPVERFLGLRYYLINTTQTAPSVRLLQYNAEPAPDTYTLRGPETLTDLEYTAANGESLSLVGFTLPRSTTVQPGDALPLSLYWRLDEPANRDYKIAWFIADTEGRVPPVQGEDSFPGATFEPTTRMIPGLPVWDHRAMFLPPDLPPGEYWIWVKVYDQDFSTGAITDLSVTGTTTDATNNIGVLPVTLTVE